MTRRFVAVPGSQYGGLTLVCLLAALFVPNEAWASDGDGADPFGGEDPFSVIRAKQDEPTAASPAEPENMAQHRVELFLKGFYADINNTSRINPDNRFQKLEVSTGMGEARATYSDYLDQQQTVRWLFKGYGALSSYQGVDTPFQGGGDVPVRSTGRVDEIFADWRGDGLFASVGKRRITWGHAQGFNPVNVVAPPRDPLNPEYQTEGQPLVWLSSHSAFGNIDLILTRNYDENWKSDQNRWGARWGGSAQKIDYAVYYFAGQPYRDGRLYERMTGASFSADVAAGMTVYGEVANFLKNYRNYYFPFAQQPQQKGGRYSQAVVGSSLDLGSKSSVFVELLYNGQGYAPTERLTYLQAVDRRLSSAFDPVVAGDFVPLSLNRNYLLVNYRKEYREKYNFNLSMLRAGDGSSSTRAAIYYTLTDYYELRASYLNYTGSRDSEFGNNPYRGLLEFGLKASF